MPIISVKFIEDFFTEEQQAALIPALIFHPAPSFAGNLGLWITGFATVSGGVKMHG